MEKRLQGRFRIKGAFLSNFDFILIIRFQGLLLGRPRFFHEGNKSILNLNRLDKIASPEDRPANHCTVHGFIFAQHLLEKVRYSLQTASSVESLLRITQKAVRQNCLSRLKRWLSGN